MTDYLGQARRSGVWRGRSARTLLDGGVPGAGTAGAWVGPRFTILELLAEGARVSPFRTCEKSVEYVCVATHIDRVVVLILGY